MDREQIIEQLLNALLTVRQTLEQQIRAIDGQIEQMHTEQVSHQALNAFVLVRQTLDEQIHAIDRQVDQARRESWQDLLERQEKELGEWLEEIDQSLIDCCEYIDEYQRLYTEVRGLRARVSPLGGGSTPTIAPLPGDSLEGAIVGRIQHLRGTRKL